LKKSLWYGVCDIAGELLPGRKRQRVAGGELRVAREEAEVAGSELLVASEEGRVVGKELRVTSENQSASGPATSYPQLVTSPTGEASLRDGEFWAVKDVSFELRRGELRTLGRSEKEISKKCLGATKVPDSGRRRHQCLGLIGHNGAGKTTLLKMLNGLIKPDRGTITMRGRVGALIALGAGLNPILTT
jgi:ABC-type sugar transport system ATPase subunit